MNPPTQLIQSEAGLRSGTEVVPGPAFRRLRAPQDYAAMAQVFNRSMAADGVERMTDAGELTNLYAHLPNFDPEEDLLLTEAGGELIGYVSTSWRRETRGDWVYRHFAVLMPEWRRKGLGRVMLQHAERRLCRVAQGHGIGRSSFYQATVADPQVGTAALLLGHGYVPVRRTYQMVRPSLEDIPTLSLPPGLEVRPARPEHYRLIWEANQEAFRDHWGHVPVTEEDYQRWIGDPTFDPRLWCVAWEGNQVAGMVLNLVNAAENNRYNRRRGYTEDICVRRPWRRRGLARALIARSLIVLREQGMTEAGLGVDAENWSGAMRLYQSMGYRIAQCWSHYRRPVARP